VHTLGVPVYHTYVIGRNYEAYQPVRLECADQPCTYARNVCLSATMLLGMLRRDFQRQEDIQVVATFHQPWMCCSVKRVYHMVPTPPSSAIATCEPGSYIRVELSPLLAYCASRITLRILQAQEGFQAVHCANQYCSSVLHTYTKDLSYDSPMVVMPHIRLIFVCLETPQKSKML
jgi:hypothetical protein